MSEKDIQEEALKVLKNMDGSVEETVKTLTGFTSEELEELGGFDTK